MRVVEVPAEATHGLRRAVLRVGMPDVPVANPQDDQPGAFHLGVFDPESDRLVAVGSFAPEETPCRPGQRAWRLRGMAVAPDLQGRGVGQVLLDAAVRRLRDEGATVLWANARNTALGFYERFGMTAAGETFLEIDIPHTVVVLDL